MSVASGGQSIVEHAKGTGTQGADTPTPAERSAFHLTLVEEGLAQVLIDVPGQSVNTLSAVVMDELETLVSELAAEQDLRVVVFSSAKEKGFVAGADLAELEAVRDPDEGRRKVVRGQKIFQRLAELPFETVAAIHGACLGGGLEMALACRRRIAALDAELGLPEVNLGIIPAWGGTQRLPRLIGPRAAIDLICSGKKVDGKRAFKLGLVDRIAPASELQARTRRFAHELMEAPEGLGAWWSGRRRAGGRVGGDGLRQRALEENPLGRKLLFRGARQRILERTGGHYPAPLRALQAVEEGMEGSLEAGLAVEARLVSDLLVSARSKNLIHVFHLFESVKKSRYAKEPAREHPFARASVVGAGVMGSGIAQLLASAGVAVRLKDVDLRRVGEGLRAAHGVFEERVRRRSLDRTGMRRQMSLISGTTGYEGLGRVDLAIEAVAENLDVKRGVFSELERRAPAWAVLCTNTSSLRVADVTAHLTCRERVAGLHFFNPAHRMPLVEIVRTQETSDETVAALYRLALRLRKKPIVVKDGPGFLVNRLLMPYLNEAMALFQEGADTETIDLAMTAFGMPAGPLALLDDIGLDVACEAGRVMSAAFGGRRAPAALAERLAAGGRTGRKGGRGFYLYEGSSRKAPDSALRKELGLPSSGSSRNGHVRWEGAASEIERRLLYPMIDEAAICLAEGVVAGAAEVDLAMIAGAGFPPFRGGLLRHADAVGLETITAVLRRLGQEVGARFTPSRALEETAARGGFYAACSAA